jgi:hypothetical protein
MSSFEISLPNTGLDQVSGVDEIDEFSPLSVSVEELDSSEKGFPLQNKIQVTSELGIVTDIVCTIYSDQYFVVISQNGKFGTMIKATAEYHNDNSAGVTFETTVLLGQREDTLAHLYARQIIEKLSTKSDKPVIVSISLIPEGRTMETVKDVMSALFKV